MMKIKSIDTEYNGYLFRSRLEARWAIVFDTMHIKYEYEPEGFKMDCGLKYLPDFLLTEMAAYIEIKPSFSTINYPEIEKLVCFAQDKPLFLIVGAPLHHTIYKVTAMDRDDFAENYEEFRSSYDSDGEYFQEMIAGNEVYLAQNPLNEDEFIFAYTQFLMPPEQWCYKNALQKGAKSRFEFNK